MSPSFFVFKFVSSKKDEPMKTLKTLIALLFIALAWHTTQAQCAYATISQQGNSDTVAVKAFPLASDSASATITWDFGDGHTYVGAGAVQHIYSDTGVYLVCYTYSGQQCTSTECDSVYISADALCGQGYWISTSITGHQVTFSVAGAPVGAIYNWNFGAGASISASTSSSPVVDFSGATYAAMVDVSYNGCIKQLSIANNFSSSANTCNANWSSNAYGKDVRFWPADYQYFGDSYYWSFGDGTVSTEYSPAHFYNALGSYNVCYIVSKNGCSDTVCNTITLTAPPCVTSDSLFYSIAYNWGEVRFDAYGTNQINPNASYSWDFGDGSTVTDSFSLTHYYATAGSFNVCLNYADDYCTVSSCKTIDVELCPYYSQIVQTVTDAHKMKFSISNAQSDWNYAWSFSNGLTSTDSTVELTFATGGTYTGTVTISSPTCQAITLTTQINVYNEGFCHLGISYTRTDNTVFVSVDSSAVIPINSRLLDYGDGFTTDYQFAHTYNIPGTYNICLTHNTTVCGTITACEQVTIPGQVQYTYLTGTVHKGSNPACNAIVYIVQNHYGVLSLYDTLYVQDSAGLCSGTFAISLPIGADFKIKAALLSADADYANYLPTYYGNELNWINATDVNITQPVDLDINLIAGTNPGGPGFIGGLVSQGAGLGVINNHNNRAVGDPLPNIQINLLTDNDMPVAYTYSDGSGMFAFNNIPLGSYKVYAEAISKTPVIETVTLTANNPSTSNVNVEVNTSNAVTSINDIAELKVDAVYPNPVKDVAVLRFTAKQNAKAKVQVTDVRGVVVYTSATDINTGSNELKIDLANHAAGVYVVTLTNKDNNKTIRLLKAN